MSSAWQVSACVCATVSYQVPILSLANECHQQQKIPFSTGAHLLFSSPFICHYILYSHHAQGDITKCENYRTISLINHSSKILLEIIRSRMKPYVEAILAEEQAGFRAGCSTVEQVFALKMLILVAFEMRCYRKVLNITWKDKIRNEDVFLRISSCKFKPKRILAHITE